MSKPSSTEEEYFAREDAEKKKRLALEEAKKLEQAEKERLKNLHYMRCPKCGMQLQEVLYRDIYVDKCFSCGYVGFDNGELDKLTGDDTSIVQSVVKFFKS
ncbi:MAG: hypothetical protein GMKNLPBB_02042 [Myxococcota bacterium]|nr:hypothetical protein [Myxococcota bacterium]